MHYHYRSFNHCLWRQRVCKLASLALATLASSWYIYQIQEMDMILRLISIVVVLGFAAWFTMLFLRK
ncbi:hypothetical protein [Streptococcus oricebi]